MVLEFVEIAVGAGEPLGCPSCSRAVPVAYASAEDVGDRIAAAAASSNDPTGINLLLTGPEPFDHPQLPLLVAGALEAGATRVAIETDGAALSVGPNARGVLSAGVRHLRIRVLDLDAESQRTRDMIAGIQAYRAAAEAAAVAVVVTAVIPVCRHVLPSLSATVSHAALIGFDAVRLVAASELPSAAAQTIAAACDTGMVNRLWVETDGRLPLPGSHAAHAVPSGGIDG